MMCQLHHIKCLLKSTVYIMKYHVALLSHSRNTFEVNTHFYIIIRVHSGFSLVTSCVLLKYTHARMTSTDGVI